MLETQTALLPSSDVGTGIRFRHDPLRAEQAEVEPRGGEKRKADMDHLTGDFEQAVRRIVDTVSSASNELESAAATLTRTAATTQSLSTMVAASSEQASPHVQSVASAAEEFSGSVAEIGRQVLESKRIASEAVKQAETTNARMSELSQSATRIGDVVKLITSVADQTNLLARCRPGGQGAGRPNLQGDRGDFCADCRYADGH